MLENFTMMIELLVLVVIVAGLSLAVYHIAQFSTKETPFEEALAEQRQKRSLEILPTKTEKILKKTKLKKVKTRKEENTATSAVKDTIVPVHRPTTTKSKESVTPQAVQLKEKNAPEPAIQKRGLNAASLQPQKAKPLGNISTVENIPKPPLEKREKKIKEEKAEEKSFKRVKKEELKPRTQEGSSDEKDGRKVKKEEKAKKAAANEVKKAGKDKERTNKQEIKEGKDKMKENKEERRSKKEETKGEKKERKIENKEEKKEQESRKSKRDDSKEEKMEMHDHVKKGKSPVNCAFPHPAGVVERASNKKITEPAPKNSPGKGTKPQTASSPKKTSHSAKESKQKNNEESQRVEKAKVSESSFRSSESTAKAQLHELASAGGSPSQNNERKRRKEREERKRMISLSDDVVSRLMPIIQRAQLSGGEVQTLIDALLNKQQLSGDTGGGEWVAKGRVDPVIQLRRQLEETEARLREQTDAHETLSAKIVDLRSELNSERVRSSALKKQLEGAGTLFQQRLDAATASQKEHLVAKLAEQCASLSQEYQSKLTQHQQKSAAEHEGKLKEMRTSLSEIEAQLQKAKSGQQESEAQCQQVQATLADAQQQLQATSQEREELMATCQQYRQHLASMKEQLDQQEADLNARLYEAQEKASTLETAHSQVVMQLTQLANENEMLQRQLGSLDDVNEMLAQSKLALKKITREKSDLEKRFRIAERNKTDLHNRLHQTDKKKKDLESRLQETNDDRKELVIQLAQMEGDNNYFTELLNNQKTEIECLKGENESLASQSVRPAADGRENGDVHDERGQQQSFAHIHEEKISALTREISRLKEVELLLRRKSEELEKGTKTVLLRIYPSLKVAEHLEHGVFLQEVETASAAVKARPTPIVEKVVEKIVEKVVPDPKLCQQVNQLKEENADLHKKIEDLRAEKTLLEIRVERLSEEKASLESSVKSSLNEEEDRRSLITKLELDNKGLTEKIANYQDILANTESLLKTLQKSVESEESTWHEKLLQKEELVHQLTDDKKNLALQVSELQSSLDKVKQAEEAAAQLCDLQFAYNCMEKSLPSILSQMESQLNCLKEKLTREEEAKEQIQEQLNKAQEQLKVANSVQVSTNGPANGVDGHENEVGQAETISLVSSEGHGAPTDGANKKKKRKKAGSSVVSE